MTPRLVSVVAGKNCQTNLMFKIGCVGGVVLYVDSRHFLRAHMPMSPTGETTHIATKSARDAGESDGTRQ